MFPDIPKLNQERTALLDGDIIAFKAAHMASSKNMAIDELEFILQLIVDQWMQPWFSQGKLVLSSSNNFRKEQYPDYKANRKGEPPKLLPDAYAMLYDWGLEILKIDTLEADDVMGIYSTHPKTSNMVIVSTDKDMKQIPGWIFNPDKDAFPWRVTEAEARRMLAYQIIRGDAGDGYNGIYGMGEIKTNAWLDTVWDGTLDHIKQFYIESHDLNKELGEQEYNKMYTLAKILTADDYFIEL